MSTVFGRLRSPIATCVLLGILVSVVVLGLRSLRVLESIELVAYDWGIRLRGEAVASDPRVALVAVTEDDIRNQGRWPLTDGILADALERLARLQPRAIGLDIYRDIPVPPGLDRLNEVLLDNRRIVVATKLSEDPARLIPAPPAVRNTDQVGFNDIIVDRDGIVRRGLLIMDHDDRPAYSFALRQALLFLGAQGIVARPDESNPDHLRLGKSTLRPFEGDDGAYIGADARGYQMLLDFRTLRTRTPSFSLTELLAGRIDAAAIKNKVVLLGVMAESVTDLFYTPHGRGFGSAQPVAGVALHAEIVNQLLRIALDGDAQIAVPGDAGEASWTMLWGMAGGMLAFWARSPWRNSVLAASGLLLLALAAHGAFLLDWWIPVVPPAIAWLGSSGLVTAYLAHSEKEDRELLMQMFSRHVSPEVAETLWLQRDHFMEGGRPRPRTLVASVLFTDLKGFTSVSERLEPQALMDWLNSYMETMAQLVMQHGGVVDDYFGDAIKANFGVPIARTDEAAISRDAVAAVDCALAMERELKRLNARWQRENLPTVAMRVGIFTGPVVAGSLGAARRLKYTTIGDTVNIASRLESIDKDIDDPGFADSPCRILVGEATLRRLDGQFETMNAGETALRGKAGTVNVFRVRGRSRGSARAT